MKLLKLKNRNLRIAFVSVLLGIILVVVFYFLKTNAQNGKLPQDFIDARKSSSEVSQKIVDLTNATNGKIKSINLSDFNSETDQALISIKEARETNNEAYAQAFELSKNLQKLAESLNSIKSPISQRLAYEAVAVELSLVSEFITYTQSLNNFLDSLGRAISSNSLSERKISETYLKEVNGKVEKINNLNEEFLAKITAFDKNF